MAYTVTYNITKHLTAHCTGYGSLFSNLTPLLADYSFYIIGNVYIIVFIKDYWTS